MRDKQMRRHVIVAALLCALASGTAQAGGGEDVGLRWGGKLYVWHYNPEHHPS